MKKFIFIFILLLTLSGCGNELYKSDFTPEQQKVELQKLGFVKSTHGFNGDMFTYDLSSFEVPELEDVQDELEIIVYFNFGFNHDQTDVTLRTGNEILRVDVNGICSLDVSVDNYNCTGQSLTELQKISNLFYALDNEEIYNLWYDVLSIMHIEPEEIIEL